MNVETNRLNTFANWPFSAPVDPVRIAKAGFFYSGRGTEVECFSCGGKISEWNYGDQVMSRHRTMEPNCAFIVNSQLSGNVPMVLGRECSPVQSPRRSTENDDNMRDRLTEEDDMYQNHVLRLLSFVNWEDTSVSRESLVSAGFYHMGGGRIRCAWCAGELAPFRNLGSLGTPLDVHRMYFPRCPLLSRLEREQQSVEISPLSSPNTPPLHEYNDSNTNKAQSSGAEHNRHVMAAGGAWRELGVVGGNARHPSKAALATRLATYERWPVDRSQTPRALADAGFFYTGVDDQVRCYYCDGGLGKWEQGDAPWSEHARWFPGCGYVLLVKGQEFIDACQKLSSAPKTISADRGPPGRSRNQGANISITERQLEESMGDSTVMAALAAGLDAARVRRAVVRRLRTTGLPFSSPESLIDAVLDEQLNEEAWSATPQSSRLARDILAETLREFLPAHGMNFSNTEDRLDSQASQSASPLPSTNVPENNTSSPVRNNKNPSQNEHTTHGASDVGPVTEKKQLTLEEENRQLKEARLCKVCMDNEVSVVFLPCGHLVACAGCGAALAACPLCRGAVRALVRAYLA